MMAEDELNDDVTFRGSGEPVREVFRPSAYQVYQSSDEDPCTSDDADMEAADITNENLSKPLMPPRQRPILRVRQHIPPPSLCQRVFWPLVYMFIFVASMAAFVCLIIYIVDIYTNKLLLAQKAHVKSHDWDNLTVVGCSKLSVEDVWLVGLPKLLTESAFRLVDVNQDGTLDIILGFATGADKMREDPLVCDIYFNGMKPCGGGILALDGKTGVKLWEHRASHEIFALNCAEDLNQDGIKDCIGGGRAGTFQAASGRDGSLLWKFNDSSLNVVMNAYTGQYVGDLDGDGVPDILNIHGGDPLGEPGSATRLVGKIVVFSGRTGKVLSWSAVPDEHESYYSPVVYRRRDGTDYVLFGTGGETHSGALWLITLRDLEKGNIDKAIKLYNDDYKGIMTPPVLLDLNKDGTEDIIFATYNSTTMALDGETYDTMWNFSYPNSETYATPAAGFYNDDDIPDFIIRWQSGPGFPIYYHSIMTVLDGATGLPLITPYPRDSIGGQTSPLTLTVEGTGNDIFLYWISDCHGQQGKDEKFTFLKGTNVHEQSRADFCRLRFKKSGYSKMLAVSQSIQSPGQPIYNSEERYHVERAAWVNTTALAQTFLQAHPDKQRDFEQWQAWVANQQSKWREKDKLRKYTKPLRGNDRQHLGDYDRTDANRDQLGNLQEGRTTYGDYTGYKRPSLHPDEEDAKEEEGDEELREKITSIVSELLGRADELEEEKSGGENVAQRPSMGPKSDIKKRLRYEPEKNYERHRYAADSAGSWSESIADNLGEGTLSWDSKGLLYGAKGSYQAHEQKSGRGVEEAKQEVRMQKLHDQYLESFGRRKRRHQRGARAKQKRHVGPHDEGGLQRLISTGTLVPPLLDTSHPDYARSMDVVFATYWFYPAKTKILLPEDEECVKRKMDAEAIRFKPSSHYYGMDHDAYGHAVLDECLEESGHAPESGTFESQSTYNPYNLHMGQMTIYRLRLKCECGNEAKLRSKGQRCARFLPHNQQQWAAYMGSYGDSHWVPRNKWSSSTSSKGR